MLLDCLESIARTKPSSCEVIIVDNASADRTIEEVKSKYGFALCIENRVNLGFSGGCNMGMRRAKGVYCVLLNQDTIVSPGWLEELLRAASRNGLAFYSPRILLADAPRILDAAGNDIHLAGFGMPRGLCEVDSNQYDKLEEVAYANGTCLFFHRDIIRIIGLLDSRFFAFGEDLDWGWRGRLRGIKSYYVPQSKVYHKWGGSFGRQSRNKMYLAERNRIITILKNYSARTLIVLLPVLATIEVSVIISSLGSMWFREKIRGYSDLIRLRGYIASNRRLVQAERTAGDAEVIRRFSTEFHHPLVNGSALEVLNRLLRPYVNLIRDALY